ncbi:neuronal acetylcholine receptor subunit alpha-10-like [Antedon mediterranea]|uniref:neuronal acetylcholine receptor subunit alpha-10-like n=1 Tax=Antedon mediterranea TaxID=105859 RepID=UPI003AF629A8
MVALLVVLLRCFKSDFNTLYLVLLHFTWFSVDAINDFEEARLVDRLLDGYSKDVRPVQNYAKTIHLEMSLTVVQLVDMDELNQIMTTNVWFNKKWTDYFLTWNPEEFDNITTTVIDSSLIWLPDITMYNNANEDFTNGIMKTKASISFDGTVQWDTPAILKSTCQLDPLFFPFDQQNCTLTFGSFIYHENQLNITCPDKEGDTTSFQTNGEWTLVSAPIVRDVEYYPCCPEFQYRYPSLHFQVILRRQPLFFLLNLIFPCILISALVLFGFYLPSDAGEKVTLTITIMLALNVFLLLVAETMPPTSKVVPLIGQYFILNIILVGICTATTVIILGIHHHGSSTKVPKWLHTLVLVKLANLLNMDNGVAKLSKQTKDNSHSSVSEQQEQVDNQGVDNPVFEHDNGGVLITEADMNTSPSTDSFGSSSEHEHSFGMFEKYIQNMTKCVFSIGGLIRADVERKQRVTEWMEVATILDRFFMILFGIVQLLITVITLSLAAVNKSVM